MQIGILQCDNVRSSLSPEYGEYPKMIEDNFMAALNASQTTVTEPFTFRVYRIHEGILPDKASECDAYVITGSRYSVLDSDELWINQLQNFIVRLNKAKIKTIGICFGHQIMAVAMEGKVERADCGWQIGVHRAEVVAKATFMQPEVKQFHMSMLCEDQVQKVPDSATVLAKTASCDYAMLQYNGHMLSTQGHPEFSKAFAKTLLNVRQDEFPRKRFERGIASFSENDLDGSLVFQWFVRFILQSSD